MKISIESCIKSTHEKKFDLINFNVLKEVFIPNIIIIIKKNTFKDLNFKK